MSKTTEGILGKLHDCCVTVVYISVAPNFEQLLPLQRPGCGESNNTTISIVLQANVYDSNKKSGNTVNLPVGLAFWRMIYTTFPVKHHTSVHL